jgi:pilus assembly protein CpaB
MGRRTLLLIASLLIAAVGTALIALYVRGADARAQEGTEQVKVAFAAKSITAGSKVDDLLKQTDVFTSRTVARASLPGDPINSVDILRGQVALVGIVEGAPLQQAMFGRSTGTLGTVGISKRGVGVSFELTDPQRVAGLLSPGMFVEVYSVPKDGDAKLALGNSVEVLQIGTENVGSLGSPQSAAQQAVNPNADQVPRAILTFDLTRAQALELLKDKRDGDLALGLLGNQPVAAGD